MVVPSLSGSALFLGVEWHFEGKLVQAETNTLAFLLTSIKSSCYRYSKHKKKKYQKSRVWDFFNVRVGLLSKMYHKSRKKTKQQILF